MAAAGMPDGSYQLGPQAVTVSGGIARLSGGDSIAGGTAHLLDCVRVAVERAGISLVDAVHMASAQGARILGDPEIGSLRAGCRADVVAVDDHLHPVAVWRRGTPVL
uniref:CAZy families CE9 protein n=1 Tax=uncultured Xylanimonas sp. TaxID=876087 RepID=A0A060C2T1_9MICO|nr:CAZy families CE9 protein [uncultured Xylanimonas sp.]